LPFSSMTISWSSNRFFLCGPVRACKSLSPCRSEQRPLPASFQTTGCSSAVSFR
jgi:hypothetical protein